MSKRGLDRNFLAAMREKLECGRVKGRVGWDRHWLNTYFEGAYPEQILLDRLHHEVLELAIALDKGDKKAIRLEAADVANFAMMIADITGSLDTGENHSE